MTISRRDILKVGIAAGTALSIPSILRAQTGLVPAQTVRMVMITKLSVFDPIFTTAGVTAYHAMAIYDTLFALDSKLMPQPQMVGNWTVTHDKRTYTFELRDGLSFHDGTPVTAADCVASIHRWGEADDAGKLIVARARDISAKDDKTFTIGLNEPLGLLVDLLAYSSRYLPIMREKDAKRSATEQVTENIGSGPFKFNQALAKPGVSFTYDRNEDYVPRKEPSDGFAGGAVAKVDRIVWEQIGDPQTAYAALQVGEIDFIEFPPADFHGAIESDPNLALQVLNKSGDDYCLRLNHLQKPFNNIKARQAMLHLIDQEEFLRVISPNPQYGRPVTSIFGNSTLYSNDENTGWYKKGGDAEKAKQLFKEAGYTSEKVVILQGTDWAEQSNAAQLVAAKLREIGVNAELAPSDWPGVIARRAKKEPVEDGGWSIFITSASDFGLSNPLTTSTLKPDWYGWPMNEEFEALRSKWTDLETVEQRKALAREMQRMWWNFVGDVRLGQVFQPVARRRTLTGLIEMPASRIALWNMQKA